MRANDLRRLFAPLVFWLICLYCAFGSLVESSKYTRDKGTKLKNELFNYVMRYSPHLLYFYRLGLSRHFGKFYIISANSLRALTTHHRMLASHTKRSFICLRAKRLVTGLSSMEQESLVERCQDIVWLNASPAGLFSINKHEHLQRSA